MGMRRQVMYQRPSDFLGNLVRVRALEETGKSLRASRFIGFTTDRNVAEMIGDRDEAR
jgi:hypothetical protein